MESISLNSTDTIAQLKKSGETTSTGFDNFFKFLALRMDSLLGNIFPKIYAQVSSVKPVDLSSWDVITKKINGGSLEDLNPIVKVYESDDNGFIFRSTNKYICIYTLSSLVGAIDDAGGSYTAYETKDQQFNNPFTTEQDLEIGEKVLSGLKNNDGTYVETYDLNGKSVGSIEYSEEASSCDYNEVEISCDTSSLPINIHSTMEADDEGGLLAIIQYVESFQEFSNACQPNLKYGQFLIKSLDNGVIYEIFPITEFCIDFGPDGGAIWREKFVLKPNGAFNTSDKIIVNTSAFPDGWDGSSSPNCVYQDKDLYIRSIKVDLLNQRGQLIVKQLSPTSFSDASYNNSTGTYRTTYFWEIGRVAFDGENLFLQKNPQEEQATFYVFPTSSDGFDIIRPEAGSIEFMVPDDQLVGTYPNGENAVSGSFRVLEHMGQRWFPSWYSAKTFDTYSNNSMSFVFDQNNKIMVFSNGWAHGYDVNTKVISKWVDDSNWPPAGYGIYTNSDRVFPHLNDCPDQPAENLSHLPSVEGTTSKPTCMIFPNILGTDNVQAEYPSLAVDRIMGRWKNNIIMYGIGSWNPETFIHSGQLGCLPYRPTCKKNSGTVSLNSGFFDHADQYMFFVNTDKNRFVRYDIDNHTFNIINLDDYSYLPEGYEVTKESIYVEVINASNSNKEYLKIDFATGAEDFLGTIQEDDRTVIKIDPLDI
tara:strand:- start:684 stop:2789 length:2106 start_codon:yes stop_codon:yes gene_type:complete